MRRQHARQAGGSARKPHALEHAALLLEHGALLSPQPWALARAEDAADLGTPGAALRYRCVVQPPNPFTREWHAAPHAARAPRQAHRSHRASRHGRPRAAHRAARRCGAAAARSLQREGARGCCGGRQLRRVLQCAARGAVSARALTRS
jgi:hypothetical protein